MSRRKDRARTPGLWVATNALPRTGGHPFYQRLNQVLDQHGFDAFVEAQCATFYAPIGRPSLLPGTYFRLLLIGYFEGLDSERGIAWRTADFVDLCLDPGHPPGRRSLDPVPEPCSLGSRRLDSVRQRPRTARRHSSEHAPVFAVWVPARASAKPVTPPAFDCPHISLINKGRAHDLWCWLVSRGGRVAESVVACTVLNQMTELGRPESYSIGQ